MDTSLCRLCKEPITNVVCPDHLTADIARWLPVGMEPEFRGFSRRFSHYFHSAVSEPSAVQSCMVTGVFCTSHHRCMVCVHCTINEVYHWLVEKDGRLADRFLDVFSFGFRKEEFREVLIPDNFQPIHNPKRFLGEGFCDDCEQYSDVLVKGNGRWSCDQCRE